ncbi:winged helix DNA-binding protein [Kiloniella laminariae]|uniref:Winged helix DNA-binding protein n=1 Tax=Kiloniella laminariae TaxID=454162 RepID=A0ABT4LMY3_9PROT|nr:winged helix DNA-binding protein [Kiloniella laminariae]MCZ4282469.1 winged helix DNA-binding protein [Kiloniella laminariae]
MSDPVVPPQAPRPIVSSEHLASEQGWQMSELEYGMIIAFNGFSRWMVRCMNATGLHDFNPLDVLVLHNVNHRKREKRLNDICFVLNIEDPHTVNYSLKKLIKGKLVKGSKRGKEIFYSTTEEGIKACAEYRKIRDLCLIDPAVATETKFDEIARTAQILRSVSGLYDQASRAAASF